MVSKSPTTGLGGRRSRSARGSSVIRRREAAPTAPPWRHRVVDVPAHQPLRLGAHRRPRRSGPPWLRALTSRYFASHSTTGTVLPLVRQRARLRWLKRAAPTRAGSVAIAPDAYVLGHPQRVIGSSAHERRAQAQCPQRAVLYGGRRRPATGPRPQPPQSGPCCRRQRRGRRRSVLGLHARPAVLVATVGRLHPGTSAQAGSSCHSGRLRLTLFFAEFSCTEETSSIDCLVVSDAVRNCRSPRIRLPRARTVEVLQVDDIEIHRVG
ncbi:hypothetical protein SCALM49S_05018 [Streptomyces californicus]